MRIDIALGGYGKASELICGAGCPCLTSDEYGYDCSMGYYLGWLGGDFNGWVNLDTGEIFRKKSYNHRKSPGARWHRVIIRPQVCIDKHGK